MDSFPCLVFPHADADGPANMARDEALFELVTADPVAAAFRTYGWTEPTLSLGYFQSVADAESDPRWRGVPVVRRPTGGGAIVHDREVTYALAVPRGHPLARGAETLYRAVHDALAGLLSGLGLDAHLRGDAGGRPGADRRPFLCFADRDPEDVVAGAAKLVGSAQRRRAGAVLQHGSVLLARSPVAPELPGVADLAPGAGPVADWPGRVREAVLSALGFEPRPAARTDQLFGRAAEIERAVYRSAGWARRR